MDGAPFDASAGHLVVRAGAFSRSTVVLRFQGTATLVENVEIIGGDSAELTVAETVRHFAAYYPTARDPDEVSLLDIVAVV